MNNLKCKRKITTNNFTKFFSILIKKHKKKLYMQYNLLTKN